MNIEPVRPVVVRAVTPEPAATRSSRSFDGLDRWSALPPALANAARGEVRPDAQTAVAALTPHVANRTVSALPPFLANLRGDGGW